MPRSIALLFDFDGTLYVGDLPVLAYARHCAEQLPDDDATALIDGIRYFLEGKTIGGLQIDLSKAEDGYQGVEILAAAAGLTEGQIGDAYRLARMDLAGSAFALDAPLGLRELLVELHVRDGQRPGAHVLVVTNADAAGVHEVLAATELADQIDEVVNDAGKPSCMPAVVAAALSRIDAEGDPSRLMAIGDRWANDLADAHVAGCATAMVDRFGRGDGTPTLRAPTLAAMLPQIRDWARMHHEGAI